jgi:hypothetical protein
VAKTRPGFQPSAQDISSAFVIPAPDLQQRAQQATMEALKGISPMAAAATGAPQPNYQGFDINAGLNRLNYGFGGPAQGAVPAAPPMAAPVPPSGPAQPLLPPGYAGMPGLDPRLSGQFNPWANTYAPSFGG